MGRALKQSIVASILALAVAGCTTMTPKVEPAPTVKHKVVRTTTTPKVVKQKKVTGKKLIQPVQTETAPVVIPTLGGGSGGGGGGGSGGSGGGGGGWGG